MLTRKIFFSFIVIIFVISIITVWFARKQIFPGNATIVFVGDSMTEYLGNFDELRAYLKNYYPAKRFLLLNYGFSATNILSVGERLEKNSNHSGRDFQAINNIPFDLIII